MLESVFTPLVVPRVGDLPVDPRDEAERARIRGYAEGFAEGRRQAQAEAQRQELVAQERMRELHATYVHERGLVLAALQAAAAQLAERVQELGTTSADRIEELAVELATSILGVELSDPARSAAHALRRAVAEAPASRWTRVSFSEADHRMLMADAAAVDALEGVEVVGSPSVDAGGAVVEIEHGAVDTRIGLALARVIAALHGDGDADAAAMP